MSQKVSAAHKLKVNWPADPPWCPPGLAWYRLDPARSRLEARRCWLTKWPLALDKPMGLLACPLKLDKWLP